MSGPWAQLRRVGACPKPLANAQPARNRDVVEQAGPWRNYPEDRPWELQAVSGSGTGLDMHIRKFFLVEGDSPLQRPVLVEGLFV
jgi:hypothetical protein